VQGDAGAELRTDFNVPSADKVRFFKVIAQ